MRGRKIPATMVTQHPDNASKPYWHDRAYISTRHESEEAFRSFAELGATEYKWDWEGKLVDESVVERLFGAHFDYFSKHPLGQDKFLTFRLPNPRVESEFRLPRAFVNIASAASVAKHFGFSKPPIFEVILPYTETAEEMLALQEAYGEINHLKHPLHKLGDAPANLQVIPLFETVQTIVRSDGILREYLALYKEYFKTSPSYMRPYVARSDPALNSGIIPTVLAIKIALSHYKELSESEQIPLYPIIGPGSLPFRGGLTPESVKDFVQEYKGVRTTTIQSAFRYDYPLEKAKKAIVYLENQLPKYSAVSISKDEETNLRAVITEAEKQYKRVVEQIAPLVNLLTSSIPQRRDRFLHIGLFGYSRGEGKVRLPRAISFTCALYSLGVPPEFIGTGQAIAYAASKGYIPLLEMYYINLKQELVAAGQYLNKGNLQRLATKSPAWRLVAESVDTIERYVGRELGPTTASEREHLTLTEKILTCATKKETATPYIEQAAILRRSLG